MAAEVQTKSDREKLVVVDNNPVICTLLSVLLEDEFDVVVATNGTDAIDIAQKICPDLILLDVSMPTPDGYEVCSQLKKDPRTSNIPVIFLTALTDEHDEEKGFSVGAVDYIKKPFSPPIVKARIRAHLDLKQQYDPTTPFSKETTPKVDLQVKRNQTDMCELESRAKQESIAHNERLTSIGKMAACMAHEIGNPLNAMGIILQKWQMKLDKNQLNSDILHEDIIELKNKIERISQLTSHIRTFGCMQQSMELTDISTAVQNALSLCHMQHGNSKIILKKDFEKNLPKVKVVPTEIEQVVLNLLNNAYYSLTKSDTKNGATPTIGVQIKSFANKINIFVEDNGGGIPEESIDHIFHPFYTTKPPAKGTGLGLSISKDIMEKYKGGLILHNNPGVGAKFEAWLPT